MHSALIFFACNVYMCILQIHNASACKTCAVRAAPAGFRGRVPPGRTGYRVPGTG